MHGLKQSDETLLQALRENAISHQVVLSKVDRILFRKGQKHTKILQRNVTALQNIFESIKTRLDAIDADGPKALGEILACSTMASLDREQWLGVNSLRWSVLAATGFTEVRRRPLVSDTDIGKARTSEPAPVALFSS